MIRYGFVNRENKSNTFLFLTSDIQSQSKPFSTHFVAN